MSRLIAGLVFLYLLGLHCSIAAMEIFSWSIFAAVVVCKLARKSRFTFPLAVPLGALAAIVGAGLLVNPELRPFWLQFGFMRWIFLLWAYVWAFELLWSEEFERYLLRVWAAAIVITATYALFQCLTGVDVIHANARLEHLSGAYRATGFFSLTLTYAYVIGTSFLAVSGPSRKLGWQWQLAVLLFGVAGITASMSRGACLAAILAGFICLAFSARRYLPVFLAAVTIALIGLSTVITRLNDFFHMRMERSSEERFHLWRAYGRMFTEHPLLGVGLFQGDRLLPEYYAKLGLDETFTSHAHNVPLQWAAGTGIFGLLLYLGLCAWFLRAAWRIRKESRWGWSLFTAQIFWHLGSLTEANFFDGEVNHMIVFTWALLIFFQSRRVPIAL